MHRRLKLAEKLGITAYSELSRQQHQNTAAIFAACLTIGSISLILIIEQQGLFLHTNSGGGIFPQVVKIAPQVNAVLHLEIIPFYHKLYSRTEGIACD